MANKKGAIPKVRKPTPFGRSVKTPRTPPQQKGNDSSVYQCESCVVTDDVDKVCCDQCSLWYHFTCANVTSQVAEQDQWICVKCISNNQGLNPSGNVSSSTSELVQLDNLSTENTQLPSNVDPVTNENAQLPPSVDQPVADQQILVQNTAKSNKSRKSNSVTSSISRKAALALQRLEEERQMREKREKEERDRQEKSDKEYLDQKYSILEDELTENSSELSYDDEEFTNLESVKEWANNVPINNDQLFPTINAMELDNQNGPNSDPRMCSTKFVYQSSVEDITHVANPDQIEGSRQLYLDRGLPITASGMIKTNTVGKPNITHDNPQSSKRQSIGSSSSTYGLTAPSYVKFKTINQPPSINIHSNDVNERPNSIIAQTRQLPLGTQLADPHIQGLVSTKQTVTSNIQQTATSRSYLKPFQTWWERALQKSPIAETIQSNPMVHPPNRMLTSGRTPSDLWASQNAAKLTGSSQPFQTSSQTFISHNQRSSNNHQSFAPQSQSQSFQTTSQTVMPQNLNQPIAVSSNQHTFTSTSHYTQGSQPLRSTYQQSIITSAIPHQSVMSSQPLTSHIPFTYASTLNGPNSANQSYDTTVPNNRNDGMNHSVENMEMSGIYGAERRLTREQIAARQVIDKKLPIFYGNPEEWDLWYNRYISTTTKCNFDNSENLDRLEKCLTGRARDIVKSRLSHSESVPWIIATLQMIFGRPETVLKSSIKKIREFPPIKADNLESLMNFAFEVQSISATIESLGCQNQFTNPMLLDELTDKLPPQEKKDWARFKRGIPNVTIRTLANWLYELAGDLSTVVEPTFVKYNDKKQQKEQQKASSSKSYLNTQVENTSMKIKKCPSCQKESCTKLAHCNTFKDASRNDKWSIVKNNKLCSRCLGGHTFYRCRSDQVCKVEGCKLNHHTLLHNNEKSKTDPIEKSEKSTTKSSINACKPSPSLDKSSFNPGKQHCNSQRSSKPQRTDIFRIIPVMFYHRNKTFRDYAYLDDGSNMTTMEESLANEMGLNGTRAAICVDWAFGQTHSTEDSRIVSVGISGFFDNAPRFKLNNVRTVKNLHLPTQSITTSWLEQYSHLHNVPIATYESVKPRILLGLQYSRLFVSFETIEGEEEEPIACRTRLGWVVQGPSYHACSRSEKKSYSMNMCEVHLNDDKLHQLVKEYFAIENFGVKVPDKILESKEIQRSREILESTTIKKDGRYETGLLWKHDDVELPDSFNMAVKRLRCLETKMEKNPQLKENLHNQIKQFLEKKYVRKLSSNELQQYVDRVWYLPTFPVFNPKKPEKVRIVWDAAAKVKNISLNSMLLSGPDQLAPLVVVLRRFRERAIAITGDIKEMYHQVRIRESDRNVQRFLWRDNPSKEPDVYTMDVMTFGSTCSPSSAQFIKNKNALEFKDKFPRAVESIIENHYVDDMIDCTHTVDEAAKLVNEVKEIHQHASFQIRNFTSNSKELLHQIGENLDQQNKNMNISTKVETERVLGMFWDTASDNFTYSLKFTGFDEKMLSGKYCPTKREVLRILMSVFDPLGLLANFLVYAKILLQEIWRSNIDWDEKITQPIYVKWNQWINMLPNVENLHIPHLYSTKISPNEPTSIQLHIFVDASVEAYATVTYLRITDDKGVDCCLIGAKTKVAPNKPMSVPRLELQAAVLGTRLAGDIQTSQTLKIEKKVFWSDSQTVMGWINSEARRYNQFVSFRIGEILEASEPKEWRWIPSEHNVADEATKSKEIPRVHSLSRWYKAPKFLYDDESTWFTEDEPVEFYTEEEMRPSFVMACKEVVREQLISVERFSNWNRLLRTQAYVFRFIYNAKCKKLQRQVGPLSQEELINAENCLYRRCQRNAFLDEILILQQNEKLSSDKQKSFDRSSELRTCPLYVDEQGVLRIKGRIDAAECVGKETKRPIILPRRHYITKLIVYYYHRRYKHVNHQTALNEIKQKYEIPALRVVMKGIRSSCQKCKNATVKPQIPEMAELPAARLAAYTEPFTYVGVDYFGPYKVKVRRSLESRWGVLFTCMTTRAIHLEVAHSLNTNSCIISVNNFMGRRGLVREFYSDNGTNFHGADNELKAEFEKLNRDDIETHFTNAEMKWKFNPPLASHMGGSWERLIRTVKNCLNQIMTTRNPTEEMLPSLFIEVENIVNSRPLTYVSLESADDEALTPNHFLVRSSNGRKPLGKFTDKNLLRNYWKAIQQQMNHFWRRFVLEYMPTLTKHTKWLKQAEPIKVGDVVLLIDETNERNTYPKGIVDEVIAGKDGKIRQAIIRTEKTIDTVKSGQPIVKTVTRIYKRPVAKLAVLDIKPPNENQAVMLEPMESHNGGEDVGQHWIANITDLLLSVN